MMMRNKHFSEKLFNQRGIYPFRLLSSPGVISDLILFISFFLAVWLWVHPAINFCYPGFWRYVPVEGYTAWFLTDAPLGPGKISYWLASLLAPALADPIAGTLVITVITVILCGLTGQALAGFGVRKLLALKYVPAMIVFFQFVYLLNPLPQSISIIIGLIALWLIQIAGSFGSKKRVLLFLGFAIIIIISAVEALLMFALLCILFESVVKRNYFVVCIEAAAIACLPAAITILFFPFSTIADTYARMFPIFPEYMSFIGLLPFSFRIFFPCIGIIAIIEKPLGTISNVFKRKKPGKPSATLIGAYRAILPGVLIILLTISIIRFNHEPFTLARPNAVMNYAMLSHKWDLLLDEAWKTPVRYLTNSKIHLVDRALYHKGRLLDDLFMFPQNQNALLLFPYSGSTTSLGPADRFWALFWGGWTYFELGLINTAEHCALEALSQIYYPQGLQLLAMIYAIKDMPEASRTCLKALRKDRAYRSWAANYLDAMEIDQKLSQYPEITSVRSVALKEEFILPDMSPLANLVKENPQNRMAFEYLIASYLIRRQIDSVNYYIGKLRELKYQKIPRLYEESILLSTFHTEKTPELYGYTLSNETMESFERFFAILYTKHGGRTEEAFNDLSASFGDSYFFYFVYGFSNARMMHGNK